MNPVDALSADDAALAVVGAGGKKTTLYTLADRLERAVVTASVRIPIFDSHVEGVAVTDSPLEAIHDADPGDFPLGVVPEREGESRYLGYDTGTIDGIVDAHDGPVLIKADGARTREFKAPNETEPQIPASTDVVVPIVSAHAVGEALTDELVHRPERVVDVATDAGLRIAAGDAVTPTIVATVLASDRGGLKGVPADAAAIPLVNKVDDDEDAAVGRAIARAFLDRVDTDDAGPSVPYVVLARMADGTVVDVVRTPGSDPTSGDDCTQDT